MSYTNDQIQDALEYFFTYWYVAEIKRDGNGMQELEALARENGVSVHCLIEEAFKGGIHECECKEE